MPQKAQQVALFADLSNKKRTRLLTRDRVADPLGLPQPTMYAPVLPSDSSDRSVRDVYLPEELVGEIFEPLRDPEFFSQVRVNPETGTMEWPNGAHLAPGFLQEKGQTRTPRFSLWGQARHRTTR